VDPDGRAAGVDDVVVGLLFLGCLTVCTIAYMQTDAYKESSQNFADAISQGFDNANQNISCAVDFIKSKISETSDVKSNTQCKTKEQNNKSSAIRFQLQTGSKTPASTVCVSNDIKGVTKKEAFAGLQKLYDDSILVEPGLKNCKDFTSAIVKMSEYVKKTSGEYIGGNVWRETFNYAGKQYRIDLENLRGSNLSQ